MVTICRCEIVQVHKNGQQCQITKMKFTAGWRVTTEPTLQGLGLLIYNLYNVQLANLHKDMGSHHS